MAWLDENGAPIPGSGEKAQLEAHVSGYLGENEYWPSESTVRAHVTTWIQEFIEERQR